MSKLKFKFGIAILVLLTIISVFGITPAVAQTPATTPTLIQLQAQINALIAQITALQAQLNRMLATPAPAPSPTPAPADQSLNVFIHGVGGGEVRGPAFSCLTRFCNLMGFRGTQINLTAIPHSGWRFDGWTGDCTGTGACIVSMTGARNVGATFRQINPIPQDHALLVVSTTAGGTVTGTGISCQGDCSEIYVLGTNVSLSATPSLGWRFDGWTGDCTGTGACIVSMTGARNVTARFVAIPTPTPSPVINNISPTSGTFDDMITISGVNLINTIPNGIMIEFLRNGLQISTIRNRYIFPSVDGSFLRFQLTGLLVSNVSPGVYQIRVVNDFGRSQTMNFTIASTLTSCTPTTCSALGFNCGNHPDGCGGTLNCGTTCSEGPCFWQCPGGACECWANTRSCQNGICQSTSSFRMCHYPCSGSPTPTPAPTTPTAPTSFTTPATNVTSTSATLNGQVNPNGIHTEYWFEHGIVGQPLSITSTFSAGSGTSDVSFSRTISNLHPNTNYQFRIVARRSGITAQGNLRTFTTPAVAPAPTPAPTVTVSASPNSVAPGASSTITWSSTNATACNWASGFTGGALLSGGQTTGALTANRTYTLSCTGTGGTASGSVTITVFALPSQLELRITGSGTITSTHPGVHLSATRDGAIFTEVPRGTRITFTATAGTNHYLRSWGGACIGTQNTCTVTVDRDMRIDAAFNVATTPTPTPTPSPTYTIVQNWGTGFNCNQICANQNPTRTCVSVGLDSSASVGESRWIEFTGTACGGTIINSRGLTGNTCASPMNQWQLAGRCNRLETSCRCRL